MVLGVAGKLCSSPAGRQCEEEAHSAKKFEMVLHQRHAFLMNCCRGVWLLWHIIVPLNPARPASRLLVRFRGLLFPAKLSVELEKRFRDLPDSGARAALHLAFMAWMVFLFLGSDIRAW